MVPNICAEFEPNRRSERYHLLPRAAWFSYGHALKHRGLTLNKAKCIFRMNRIEFMGHLLSERGTGPTESRVKALQEARAPNDSAEVRRFLGLVNFSGRFISDLFTKAEPLRRLTHKNVPFKWEKDQ